MPEDKIFFLKENSVGLNIERLPAGELMISCGTLLSPTDAEQLSNGIRAVLSGNFDRATSESYYKFDLCRRAARAARPEWSSSSPSPELDQL